MTQNLPPPTVSTHSTIPGHRVRYLVRRGGAYLIDCALIYTGVMAVQVVVFTPLRNMFDTSWLQSGLLLELYTLLTISFPAWAYCILAEQSKHQATLGKRLVKLQVADATHNGRASTRQAVLRTVVKLLPWELAHLTVNLPRPLYFFPPQNGEVRFGFWIVAELMTLYVACVALTRRRQGVHDVLANTIVY